MKNEVVSLEIMATALDRQGGFADLYSVRDLPVFQNWMFQSSEEARSCARGDVRLVRDLQTGLIFNQAFHPELMAYDANYQNEQAVSAVFRDHLDHVCRIVERHFSGSTLIEVGCGKGRFLEHLQERGFQITGLDPTYEGTNPCIHRKYFSSEVGLHAEGIILRHVLEHVQDPVGFLMGIRAANGGGGKVYIEVPCFDWICRHRAWFDVFYEHVNYFRVADFRRMFGAVEEIGHVFSGQYIYVVADLASVKNPVGMPIDDFEFPKDFLSTVDRYARKLQLSRSAPSAIWGGASKGVTFALFMERAGAGINLVIDANPAKHGKYLPATGLRVRSPEEAVPMLPHGANIVVMNGNYLEEIKIATHNRYSYLTVDHDDI